MVGRVALGSLFALMAYSDEPVRGPGDRGAAAVAVRPLAVEYAGCARVVRGPRCEIGDGAVLTLWMPESFQGYDVRVDARSERVADQVVAGGYQARIPIPAAARSLTLVKHGQVRFLLPLAAYRPEPSLEAAERAKDAGDYPRALELARPFRDGASTLDRWVARGIEARVQLRSGQIAEAAESLAVTTQALFDAGQVSLATRDLFARFFVLLHRRFEPDVAAAWLARFRSAASEYPLGRALVRENEANLAASSGETSAALHASGLAARDYERLGHTRDLRRVEVHRAMLLAELGQTAEAHAAILRLLPPPATEDACSKAQLYLEASWITVMRVEDGDTGRSGEVVPLFRQADQWVQACGDPEIETTHLVNQGLWALDRGDSAETRRLIETLGARSWRSAPHVEAWFAELRGRAALAERRAAEALAEFRRELAIGERAGDWDSKLRGLLGLADVAHERGDERAAARHLEVALAALGESQRFAPFGELAHSQHAFRQRAALRLVDALVRQARPLAAHRAALGAYQAALGAQARSHDLEGMSAEARQRYRALLGEYRRRRNALDQSAPSDWRLTGAQQRVRDAERRDELAELELIVARATKLLPGAGETALPAPEAGEFRLLFFPLQDGWAIFGESAAGVELARLSAAELERAARDAPATHPALAPFARDLRSARSIALMPAGASRRLPFERWQLDGAALGTRSLAFSAGLPRRAAVARARGVAAVVADPLGDLPIARREGRLVEQALGIPAARALSGPRATASSVLALFESADHFHFAGHAQGVDQPGGAGIVLAGRAELEAWEFFGLSSVPRHVVLSACHSGSSPDQGLGIGWGLSQVLLALGAEAVIAPQGALRDGDAYALQKRFYAELGRGAPFREAFWQAARSGAGAAAGSQPFRLFVR